MIVYEFPLNERVRILLRLEHMADRLGELVLREHPLDHHFALQTLFEIVDLCDSRSDLKSEILKELERYRQTVLSFRAIEGLEKRVNKLLGEIDQCYSDLNQQLGRLSHEFNHNEWLTSVRSRLNIPAGTCSFDHPSYHAWQQQPAAQRQQDLGQWLAPLTPLVSSIRLLMRLLRETAEPQKVMSEAGIYEQNLAQAKPYQLLRILIEPGMQLIPEISANRLKVTIRLMRRENNQLLHAGNVQAGFELSLCS